MGAATNPLIFVKQDEAPRTKQILCFSDCAFSGKASVRCRTQVPAFSFGMPAGQADCISITARPSNEQTAEEATDTLSTSIGVSIAEHALSHFMRTNNP